MPSLKIGDLVVRLPIIQGGMSVGISLSGLVSAVANEGGVGVIGAAGIGMLETDIGTNYKEANQRALRNEIRKARKMSKGVIGVNLMVALSDYDELLLTSIEEGIDVLFVGAGLPLKFPKVLVEEGMDTIKTKFMVIVSSGRAAKIIFDYWAKHYNRVPDGVVVEGPLAGGHLGFKKEQIDDPMFSLDKLLLDVISTVRRFEQSFGMKIPVIAAGGIYTGYDIYKYMKMGASGVQMATRFVATHECDADVAFKQMYVNCKQEDLIIIDSPLGLPGRAIRNKFLDDVAKGIKKPFRCFWKCLKPCDYHKAPYCIAFALANAKMGRMDYGFAFAGANAYKVDKIVSVKELLSSLVAEYVEAQCDDGHADSDE